MRFLLLTLASVALVTACATSAGESPTSVSLRVAAEAGDLDPDVLADFTRASGIEVNVVEYSDEEEAVNLLAAQSADLVVAGDQLLARLVSEHRLVSFDPTSISGFGAIDGRLRNLPFDAGNRYSVPLVWGAIGILYRTDQPRTFDSWSGVFEAARTDRSLTGKVALLDEPHPALGAAARTLGIAPNTAQAHEWSQARDALARVKDAVRFDSAAWSSDLLTGDVVVAQAYTDDAVFALATNPDLRFVNPREGTTLWVRSAAIPAKAAHMPETRRLIEFLCQPANSARTSAFTYSLSPIGEAYNKMDGNLASLLRAATPDDAVFRRSDFAALSADTRRVVEQLFGDLHP